MEIRALASIYKFNVIIHALDTDPMQQVFFEPIDSARIIHMSFHNGKHYNSVRRIDDPLTPKKVHHDKYPIGHDILALS